MLLFLRWYLQNTSCLRRYLNFTFTSKTVSMASYDMLYITLVIRVREFARTLKLISTQKNSKHHGCNFAYSAISVTIATAPHLGLSWTTQRFDATLVAFQKPLTAHSTKPFRFSSSRRVLKSKHNQFCDGTGVLGPPLALPFRAGHKTEH